MKVGFYPGCSLNGTSKEYNESVRSIATAFGIELHELKDWNCCGATAAHSINRNLSLALPARILSLAEKQGLEEIVVPCASCYNRLAVTQHMLQNDDNTRDEILQIVGIPSKYNVKILNVMQFIEKYITEALPSRIVEKLDRKVACYYGCLLIRPNNILKFDRIEDPQSMDNIMRVIGAQPINWAFKTECCGAGLSVSKPEVIGKLSGRIISDATQRGADMIIVACPMCHANLDMRRPVINRYLNRESNIPVIYITQAIGLAIGLKPEVLGINRHFVRVNLKEETVCHE